MGMRANWRIPGLAVLVAALAAGAAGAQNYGPTKGGSTTPAAGTEQRLGKVPVKKIEKLACALGTRDNHARIAVELVNGKVNRFAYYSIWKPRTCSMEVERGDVYSRWEDTGSVTVVTLSEDTGAFLIGHEAGKRFHFIFREIDRVRYCGMEGKVSGSLTIARGEPLCVLDGVMEKGE
jgi:hypothetical protein